MVGRLFAQRDLRWLSVGLGDVMALADQMIVNDNNVEDNKAKAMEALRRIEQKWKM